MCSFAYRTKAVERWDTECGREISVRAAAGRGFFEVDAQVRGNEFRFCEEGCDGGRTLHGRAIESTFDLHAASSIEGPERAELFVDGLSSLEIGDTYVHIDASFRGDYVGARASANDARIYRGSAFKIRERCDCLQLMGGFEDGARAVFKIDSSVGGFAFNRDDVAADALAGGLSFQSGPFPVQAREPIRCGALPLP